MAQVTLESVRKVYRDSGFVAVHGIDLDVRDGEFVVLVGPSGCGKSTTLRMIAGLESISSGQVSIGGRVVNDLPPKERDVAMVFQGYALYPHMTVAENMGFALALRNRSRAEIEERVHQAAEVLELTEVLQRRPRQLSGGQRQRVAIGRAIVREPKAFLFDEPLSNLDAKLRVDMRREIAALHRRLGATMIYVTHDQIEAMTLGDRIVVLDAGRVQQIDSPMALYDHPRNRFVASFIGTPAMNLVEGHVVARPDGSSASVFRSNGGDLVIPVADSLAADRRVAGGQPVTLGVRPEHVILGPVPGDASAARAATVESIEPLGYEVIVHLAVGAERLTARAPGLAPDRAGTMVAVRLDPEKVHLFAGVTGDAVGTGPHGE